MTFSNLSSNLLIEFSIYDILIEFSIYDLYFDFM